MKKFFLFFALASGSVLYGVKNPSPNVVIIFTDADHRAQSLAQGQQIAQAGQPVIIVPNVTQAWMSWQLQQAGLRQPEPEQINKG